MSHDWELHGWGVVPALGAEVMPEPANTPVVSVARDRWFCHYLPVTAEPASKLRYYLDGADYAKDLHDDLNAAKSEVCLTGLHFCGHFHLVRDDGTDPSRGDDPTTLQSVLSALSKKGVAVHLLVNQFWPDEGAVVRNYEAARRSLDELIWKISHPISGVIMEGGGLSLYLKQTLQFFEYLRTHGDEKFIHCATDIHQGYVMHSNHQKTVIVDRKIAHLGGIDLTDIDGDRWDTREHLPADPRRAFDKPERNWHDVHMRIEKDGDKASAVDFVYANFLARYNHGYLHRPERKNDASADDGFVVVTRPAQDIAPILVEGRGPRDYVKPQEWVYPHERHRRKLQDPVVQIVRSMPSGNDDNYENRQRPAWNRASIRAYERSARDAYLIAIRAAEQFIYLENQWIADEHIWRELLAKAQEKAKDPDFRILIVLPKKFLEAAGYGRQQDRNLYPHVEKMVKALAGVKEGFGVFSILMKAGHQQPERPHCRVPECTWDYTYVHSKLMIVDDCWSICGSANAGGISLTGILFQSEPDTELSAVVVDERKDASVVKELRKRLWSEHLGVGMAEVDDYRKGVTLFHDQAMAQRYDTTKAERVHFNILYYPYSAKAARSFDASGKNTTPVRIWKHLKWEVLALQMEERVREPDGIHSTWFDLTGPLTVVHMLARHDAGRYRQLIKDLYDTGRSEPCKIKVTGEDLLKSDIKANHPILEVDWMVAAAMVDSSNWFLDFEGKASETTAIKTTDRDMTRWLEALLPCAGGAEHLSCKVYGEMKAARRASKRLESAEKGTAYAAMKIATWLLVSDDVEARKKGEQEREARIRRTRNQEPALDRGDPRYWYSRIPASENPFCAIQRDRSYPLYPGNLTPYDIRHILPDQMFVELMAPLEFVLDGNDVREVRATIWVWGKTTAIQVPAALFVKAVYGFFVGYTTEQARKRATAERDTKADDQSLSRSMQREYIHEDIDRTQVEIQCHAGSLSVEFARRVWSKWEVLSTQRLEAGRVLTREILEASRVYDQDARVRITAEQDCRYSISMKSQD